MTHYTGDIGRLLEIIEDLGAVSEDEVYGSHDLLHEVNQFHSQLLKIYENTWRSLLDIFKTTSRIKIHRLIFADTNSSARMVLYRQMHVHVTKMISFDPSAVNDIIKLYSLIY